MLTGLIIIFNSTLLFGFAFWLFRRQPPEVKVFFWPALLVKLCAGMMVGYVYFYHYGVGDTIGYWQDAKILAEGLTNDSGKTLRFIIDDPTESNSITGFINDRPRSLFFVKICGIAAFLTGSNYWMMSGIFSFISFLGTWYLFRKVLKIFPASRVSASIAFLFFPSIVFWSSGLIKESLGLGSVFFLTGIFLSFYNRDRISLWEVILGFLGLWIGWNLKYYWIGVFMPVVLTTGLVVKGVRARPAWKRFELMIWMGCFAILLLAATNIHPNFYPGRFFEVICQSNSEFMVLTAGDKAVHYQNLRPEFQSMVFNAPTALMAGIFRPFIWETHDWLSFCAAIENLIVLILALPALVSIHHLIKSPHRLLGCAVMVYSILLAIFLALSTPNFGTLSRYKAGFLPFLVFLILYKNPIFEWLNRGRKSM